MVIDRSKHNKYVAKPTYGQVTQTQTSTGTTTTVIYTGGGTGGTGTGLTAEQLDKLNSIEYGAQVNQNAFSYLDLNTTKEDGTVQSVIQEARTTTDTANITINGVDGITVNILTTTGIDNKQAQSTGTNTSIWEFSYGKVETEIPAEEEGQEPTIEVTWPLVMTYISGTKVLATDFDHIVLYNKGEVSKSYEQSQLQIQGDETGITSITITEEGLQFDNVYFTITPEPAEGQEAVTTNVCIFPVLVTTTGVYTIGGGSGSYWILDEEHDAIYTPYNVYSLQEIAAYGYGTGAPGSGGAEYLYQLKDVNGGTGQQPTEDGMLLMWNSESQTWNYVAKDAVGLNEEELEQYLTTNNYLKKDQFGDLFWQELEKLFRIIYNEDGTVIIAIEALYDFYSVGEVAAYGIGEGGQAPSGTEYLYELKDINGGAGTQPTEEGTLIMWNGTTWAYVSRDSVGLNETELTQFLTENNYLKDPIGWNNIDSTTLPTTLEGYGITDAYTMQQADDRYVNIEGDTMTGDLYLPAAIATNYVQIGDARLMYDAEHHAIYVKYKDDTQVANFYSEGEVSAYGMGDEGEDTVKSYLYELLDVNGGAGTMPSGTDILLMWDGTTWQYIDKSQVGLNTTELEQYLTNNNYIQRDDLTWDNILDTPTTLVGYGITDGVNSVTTSGSGNAVTSGSISGHTLTLYKNYSFAYTTGTNATGTWDINVYWDNVLDKPSWTSSTVGSSNSPVYISNGTPIAITYDLNATVNSGYSGRLAYYSSSTQIDDYTSTIGSSTRLWYLSSGTPTNSTADVGSYTSPVYLSNGVITECNIDDTYVNESGDTMTGALNMNYANYYTATDANYMNSNYGYINLSYRSGSHSNMALPVLTWADTGSGGGYATSYFIGSRRSSAAEWGYLRLGMGVSPNDGSTVSVLSYIDIYALAGRRGKVKIYGDLFVDGYIAASSEVTAYSDVNGGGNWTIIDNLTSTSTRAALSANMGRELSQMILNLTNTLSSNYYNKTQVDDLIDGISGGDSYWSASGSGIHYNNVYIRPSSASNASTSNGSLYLNYSSSNPYYALRYSGTNYYIQGYSASAGTGLYIGSGTSNSMLIESNGDVSIPGSLAISGSIYGYYTSSEVDDLIDSISSGGGYWNSYSSGTASGISAYGVRIMNYQGSSTAASQITSSNPILLKTVNTNTCIGMYDDNGGTPWFLQVDGGEFFIGTEGVDNSFNIDRSGDVYLPSDLTVGSGFILSTSTSASSLSTGFVMRPTSSNPMFIMKRTSTLGSMCLQISDNGYGGIGYRTNSADGYSAVSMYLFNDGHITTAGSVTTRSDARLKTNIQQLQYKGYVTPKSYIINGQSQIGFIAQDVQELYPELVTTYIDDDSGNEYLALNYSQYTAVLQAQLINHEDEITQLKNRVQELENKLNQYESIN